MSDVPNGGIVLACWADNALLTLAILVLVLTFLFIGYMAGWTDRWHEERRQRGF